MLFALLVKSMVALALVLACAAAAGTLAIGSREGIAFRSALGLALCAHTSFLLAAVGQLRAIPIIALILLLAAGVALRLRGKSESLRFPGTAPALVASFALGAVLLFLLALYPPFAFDETLYHLPFVRAFAAEGVLRYLPDLRFPVFPVLHELLCVPPFLLAGDTGVHLVSLAQLIITAALLLEWGGRHGVHAGWLGAAMFLGSPLVIKLGTVLYVDMALTLFIAAGLYALDRERYALAGIFFGSACSVKYLGFYFAFAALVMVLARAVDRRRSAAAYMLACAVTALPMTAWIFFHTHNPIFPFLGTSPWALPSSPSTLTDRAAGMIRLIWDVTFARERVGMQPPITPFLAVFVALVASAAVRNARARWLVLASAGYVVFLSFAPIPDSRYLAPLLPLLSIAAAIVIAARWPKAAVPLALLAIAPGIAYAGYRLTRQGVPPPSTASQRSEWIASRVPEYRALRRAGTERVYTCGAAQLKSYAGGEFLGDVLGPNSYNRVLAGAYTTRAVAERMRRIDVRYFLLAKRACALPQANGGMELVYEDDVAQLWRVDAR